MDDIRVVLVGKAGCGKSSLGNLLLQEKKFEVGLSGSSVTVECRVGEKILEDGRKLVVVDTPALSTTNVNNKVLQKCLQLSTPGPHIFLSVIRIGRFTQEVFQAIDDFRNLFGDQVMKFVMVVFTERDTLDFDDETIENYLADCPERLKQLLSACGSRFVAVNNRSKDAGERGVVIKKLYEMMNKNGGRFYTDEMFQEAVKKMESRSSSGTRALEPTIRNPGGQSAYGARPMQPTHAGYGRSSMDTPPYLRENDHLIGRRGSNTEKKRNRLIMVVVGVVVVIGIIIVILAVRL